MFVKQVEISNFKSFGGTVVIPLLPGFTAISGPNGSGKSNILDALLFCLGLSSSKGMRAERLPDLVNHGQTSGQAKGQAAKTKRSTREASVTVTFDLSAEVARLAADLAAATGPDPQSAQRPPHPSAPAASMSPENQNNPTNLARSTRLPKRDQDPTDLGTSLAQEATDWTGDLAIEDLPRGAAGEWVSEWSVTRKLRVTQQGTYTSNYYINGVPATLTELHQALAKLRIYPEGYNVVLQGDVTGIISMNPRERRQIIDELAGVANFDRKIQQTRQTLDEVKEREDRCRILEQELQIQRDRLAKDRAKALNYQQIRQELQGQQAKLRQVAWHTDRAGIAQLRQVLLEDQGQWERLESQCQTLAAAIDDQTQQLAVLNQRVKDLGESEQLTLQAALAKQQAERDQIDRRQATSRANQDQLAQRQREIQTSLAAIGRELALLAEAEPTAIAQVETLRQTCHHLNAALTQQRARTAEIAAHSEAWVQEQAELRRELDALQASIEPQRAEQVRLTERLAQGEQKQAELAQELAAIAGHLAHHDEERATLQATLRDLEPQVQAAAIALAAAEQEIQIQIQTRDRLLAEQRDKQRQLDKLEAQGQAAREAQGTYAIQVIRQSGLDGICGLVAELGAVEPRYQLALEIAAGARLGQLVVSDDSVAAAAIGLLKQEKAGRVTFLPLNKLSQTQPTGRPNPALARGRGANPEGWIDYAVNLITYEPVYQGIFEYVFGTTVVFDSLERARSQLGRQRIVTLEGELLEPSGAMTGGTVSQSRGGLHFVVASGSGSGGLDENRALRDLRDRLAELERILGRCEGAIAAAQVQQHQHSQQVNELRQRYRDSQGQRDRLESTITAAEASRDRLQNQQSQLAIDLATSRDRLNELAATLPSADDRLRQLRQDLLTLETNHSPSEWQQAQSDLQQCETALDQARQALAQVETEVQQGQQQRDRLLERQTEAEAERQRLIQASQNEQRDAAELATARADRDRQIADLQNQIAQLETILGETKQSRDRLETSLNHQRQRHQELLFQRQRLEESQTQKRQTLADREAKLSRDRADLLALLIKPAQVSSPHAPTSASPANDGETVAAIDPDEIDPAGDSHETDPIAIDPTQIAAITAELDRPISPADLPTLQQERSQLEQSLSQLQRRLEALEPVNMLALEEFDRVADRLQGLSEKLTTLADERTELLLRIENFTTLRQQAFLEAFTAVDQHFQTIFATLSQGDGRLQLDDADHPLDGGLNLVAHPKGKPVQRLASMSGGEKSLTALSFIFALQRYRPSTFYAFDEVDMFLDGANVERLAKMVRQQAQQAQFIVVSLRRPMIEASDRTIGVTQARGAHTQVIGLAL